MNHKLEKCLVSCCLIGLPTRYDGICKRNDKCVKHLKNYHFIPICPEQLAGFPTPRPAADIVGGDGFDVLKGQAAVLTIDGADVSRQFIAGAEAVLQIARMQNVSLAILKAGSPSCGNSATPGVTTALLRNNNIDVIEF